MHELGAAAGPQRGARVLAMQALCQWDAQRNESPKDLREFLTAQSDREDRRVLAARLVERYWADREALDQRIETAATKWRLSRISPVERNVMRVAVVELLSKNVPPKVVLDEAIEIAARFGGAESPRFVNGVLDRVLRDLDQPEAGGD